MKRFLSALKYAIIPVVFAVIAFGSHTFATAPTFDNNFANYMVDKTPDQYGRVEAVFNFSACIKRDQSITQNIQNLFYPSTTKSDPACSIATGGILWDAIKVITFGLIFLFTAIIGMNFLLNGADAGKKAASNFIYLGYGAFLVYGSVWVLGYVLNVPSVQ